MAVVACNENNNQESTQSKERVSGNEEAALFSVPNVEGSILWMRSIFEALKLAREKNKPLMVDFYADWCGWCRKMDKLTYSDSEVIKLSGNFICVKVNTDKNPQDSRKYEISGLPTIIFLKSDGEIIEKVVGYRGTNDFIRIMKKISSVPHL